MNNSGLNKHPLIDGVRVDLAAVYSIAHDCRPGLCRPSECCCSCYEIEVDFKEMETIVGWFPLAGEFSRHLLFGRGYQNVFDEEGKNLFSIDSKDDGFCVFSYFSDSGRPLCSLHSAAIKAGVPPARVKPGCCFFWPLALCRPRPALLTIHQDAFSFPCNKRRKKGRLELDKGVEAIIAAALGPGFVKKIKARRRQALDLG